MIEVYLVTGIAGFIGSHIAEEILTQTSEDTILVGIDNFYSGNKVNLSVVESLAKKLNKEFYFYEGDIRNEGLLNQIFSKHKINYISHQAAIVSVQTSIHEPKLSCDVNIRGLLNLLELAQKHAVKKFVFASSAAVFGDCPKVPKNEDSSTHPISPYGFEKLLGEHYLELFHREHQLNTCAFRYFNVYGPRQDPSSEYSGVISIFHDVFQKILKDPNTPPPTIFGTGEQFRDFIFVKDIAKANFLAFHNEKVSGKVFCLGTGKKTSLLNLIDTLNQNNKLNIIPKFGKRRNGDPHASQADNSKYCRAFQIDSFVSIDKGLSQL